ncbi:pilus assembly protein [Stieleria sp. ICT_E10.1]|uniref:TadE/TadG family type IV pilus assembly protein n=1 Tax=Stieleria sedimenti TaxID=2976331 RepID=UPI0021804DC0|nr:pilus assembly protein [Stieleria sedimenti]MCS7471041.1 pilus assembly protein [Stieleria sedimenti]
MKRFLRIRSAVRRRRKGAAMIEFAVCLPVFLLITFATLETCRMIYLRQSLKLAAYESARLGILPDIAPASLQDQCDVILLGRGIENYTLSHTPSDLSALEFGNLLVTTVEAPAAENALIGSWLYGGQTVSESVTIMAEY